MTKRLGYSELLERGVNLFDHEEWKKARKVFERLVSEYPAEPRPYAVLGVIYSELDMKTEAESVLRKSIELDSDSEYVWRQMGYVLKGRARLVEAEEAFRRALKIDPDAVWSLLALAETLIDTKRYKEAREVLVRAAGIHPDEFWVWLELGRVYLELDVYDRARECYIRARERERGSAYPLNGLAETAVRSGDFREARMYYQWGLELKPDYYLARVGLGFVLVELGEYTEAESLLKSLIEEGQSDEVLWSSLGQAYLRTGRTGLAEEAFNEAVQEDPKFEVPHRMLLEIYEMQDRVEEAMATRERLRLLVDGEPMIQDVEDKMIQKVDASIRETIAELNHLGLMTSSCCSGLSEDHPGREYRRPSVRFLTEYDGAAHHVIAIANMAGWICDDDTDDSSVEVIYGSDDPEEVRAAWARLLQMARLVMPRLRIYIDVVQDIEWKEREDEDGKDVVNRDGL